MLTHSTTFHQRVVGRFCEVDGQLGVPFKIQIIDSVCAENRVKAGK